MIILSLSLSVIFRRWRSFWKVGKFVIVVEKLLKSGLAELRNELARIEGGV